VERAPGNARSSSTFTLRAFLPSASLSERVVFVGRFKNGYRVWQVVH
jgi:hypothetical protein